MPKLRTAILPVAGLGTRFLPATKSIPKEMITIVDRPVIQYVFDEAKEAGIEHFIFVTGRNKHVIEDYFDRQIELEGILQERGKIDHLNNLIDNMPKAGCASFTRQQEPLGLGHAVWCARNLLGNEPFALLLPDMLTHSKGKKGCLAQMVELYNQRGGNIIGVEEVAPNEVENYGIVARGSSYDNTSKHLKDAFPITGMVEKPAQDEAPSNLMIMGRYILQPEIIDKLGNQDAGAGGEIQITDAMQKLLNTQDFHGCVFDGKTFDCGNKIGFINANIELAMNDSTIADEIKSIMKKQLDTL